MTYMSVSLSVFYLFFWCYLSRFPSFSFLFEIAVLSICLPWSPLFHYHCRYQLVFMVWTSRFYQNCDGSIVIQLFGLLISFSWFWLEAGLKQISTFSIPCSPPSSHSHNKQEIFAFPALPSLLWTKYSIHSSLVHYALREIHFHCFFNFPLAKEIIIVLYSLNHRSCSLINDIFLHTLKLRSTNKWRYIYII